MNTLGNHGNGYPLHGHHSMSSGSGVAHRLSGFGRVAISGKIGEVRYVTTDGLSTNVCQYQAILVQAVGGNVATAATLAPPDLALDPLQTNVWVVDKPVNAGTIEKLNVSTASALRITFTTAATVYIAFT